MFLKYTIPKVFLLKTVYKLRLSTVNSIFNMNRVGKNCCLKKSKRSLFFLNFFQFGLTFCNKNTAICRNTTLIGHIIDITSND